jgi:hypothetical protein
MSERIQLTLTEGEFHGGFQQLIHDFNKELASLSLDARITYEDDPNATFNDRFGKYALDVALSVPGGLLASMIYDLLKRYVANWRETHFKFTDDAHLASEIEKAKRGRRKLRTSVATKSASSRLRSPTRKKS